MFGGSLLNSVDEDPFFDMHRAHMQHMNQMMQNPFGQMNSPFMQVTDGREQRRDHQRRGERSRGREVATRDPFGGQDPFGNMFGNMNRMMSNMRSMMTNMHQQAQVMPQQPHQPNSNFYSQSTVMTYSSDGKSQPKVYQASTSTRQTGGVKETRKTMKDSEKGVEKMSVGHHIGERSHVITKERDRSGNLTENQDLVNLDEEEVSHFDEEYRHKTRSSHHHRSGHHRSLGYTPSPIEGKLPKRSLNNEPSPAKKKVKFHAKK